MTRVIQKYEDCVIQARTLDTCETCGKLVEGEGVMMEEKEGRTKQEKKKKKVYHPECLNCSYCSKAILGKFYKIGDSVVCNSCAKIEVRPFKGDHEL